MRRFCFSLLISLSIFLTFAVPALADDPIIGEIRMYAGYNVPDGWVRCDGSQYLQSQYPDLYSVIGSIYGSAPANYFVVPNFYDRFPLGGIFACDGDDDPCYPIGSTGGEAQHTLTIPEMPAHNHPLNPGMYSPNSYFWSVSSGGLASYWHGNHTSYTQNTGGGQSHNNMPPYLAVSFIIFTGVYQNPTPTPTATATPTNTPTPTATPTGTVTIYLPQVDTYTHTLSSGKTLSVPVEISFGQLFVSGAVILVIGVVAMKILFGGAYRG